jgi:hypothetical protein
MECPQGTGTMTAWKRAILEKLIVTHLVKTFPVFKEHAMFIATLTNAPH